MQFIFDENEVISAKNIFISLCRLVNTLLIKNKNISYKQFDYLGHGKKLGMKKATSLFEIVNQCFNEFVLNHIDGQSFCFFGYSMGCLVSYEVLKLMSKNNMPLPSHVYLLSSDSPEDNDNLDFRNMTNDNFRKYVSSFEELPRELMDNEELLNFFLDITRNDFILASDYKINLMKFIKFSVAQQLFMEKMI